jgi:hypothetical protein
MAMVQESHHDDIIPNGGQIVERFGGIRPMASKLNVPVTTVQGWKKRDAIPAIRRDEIVNAARRYDVSIMDLIGTGANENARANTPNTSGTIAEDPALSRHQHQTMPAPDSILTGSPVNRTTAPQAQRKVETMNQQTPRPNTTPNAAPHTATLNTPPKREPIVGVDMGAVRKSARRTSFLTTTCLVLLAAGAGYMLFAGESTKDPRIQTLDTRVTALETQRMSAPTTGAFEALQNQVSNITTAIGSSTDGLAQLAREVAAGTNAPLTQRLAVLEAQLKSNAGAAAPALSALTDRMEAMAASPQGQAEWQSAISDLRDTVTGLSGRTDNIDTALAEARAQNDALGRTLSQVSGNDVGAAAMLLALTNLRGAVDRQAPFQQDLELLKGVSDADPALAESLDKLAPYAQSGIMSPAALKGALQASANDIITAKLRGEDVSMKEKFMLHLKSLLSIRKDGVADGSGAEQELIQTASRQLDSGDVAGAMATLQQLQGPSAQAAAPWQAQAQGTLVAQSVDMNLVNAIITKVKNGLATAASPVSSMTGVVNMGPINMGPATTTAVPAPAQIEPAPGIVQQTPPPQTMAPMEAQRVPGVVIPPAQTAPLPQTEPQAGAIVPQAPVQPSVIIQQ